MRLSEFKAGAILVDGDGKVFILAKNGRYIPFEEALKMRERINV